MSADIVKFPVARIEREPDNSARDALIAHAMISEDTHREDAERWADYALADLWSRGFKVVPL